ncbi:hypothetical protein [Cellulosilyticum ruminicola]|uniref:hypothetical protein n=1 Tax=Cellulosilyticum ruminicola TaxID=425254 RepID=UPI0006D0C89A|nr:hypothetical protein [Cellulosilyticum ruminicola]
MPMVEGENIPIYSIHDVDGIYYGGNLEEYFDIEFGQKDQRAIDFEHLRMIPFEEINESLWIYEQDKGGPTYWGTRSFGAGAYCTL